MLTYFKIMLYKPAIAIIFMLIAFVANANQWQLECPDLSNYQECAIRYEAKVIKNYPSMISKVNGKLRVQLISGQHREILDIANLHNVVDVIKSAQIAVIREQFSEGNTWHLLNLNNGKLTEIAGYPLLSPDLKHIFVIESWDISGYTTSKAAIYQLKEGRSKLVWLAKCDPNIWGPENPSWLSNTQLKFLQTKATDDGESIENGAVRVSKLKRAWVSTGLKCK